MLGFTFREKCYRFEHHKTMTIQELRDGNMIIFEGIVGSQAYGIATETSDVDIKGVFVQPLEHVLSSGYLDQVSDEKHDTTFYEIGRAHV